MIILKSTPDSITSIDNYLKSILDKYSLNHELFPEMLISLTEAVNNAIYHGNELDENKMVKVQHHFDGTVLSFYIVDEGSGFDENLLQDPTRDCNLSKSGGRGVFIIRNLCHEMKYHEQGKKLQICFKIRQSSLMQNS